MNKAQQILSELDEAEDESSRNGKIPHIHPLTRDKDGMVTGHGPGDEGPKHTHPIKKQGDGSYLLDAPTDTDPEDPDHTHTAK